ncbi:MAG: protein kinase domain-containing protein, partial [Gemmataceae bacterium]
TPLQLVLQYLLEEIGDPLFWVLVLLFLAGVSYIVIQHISRRNIYEKILVFGGIFAIGLSICWLRWGLSQDDGLSPAAMIGYFLLLGIWVLSWLVRAAFWKSRSLSCPSLHRLKDFLAERLPSQERARLAAHLEACTACQHHVEELSAGHKSWAGMARKLSEFSAAPEPALRKVMDKMKEGDVEETSDEPAFAGDLPLGFLSPTDKPGQLGRLERYEVLEEIGRGGMGVVLKAFDPSLHRVVAIKVLAPQLATSGVARKRFLREAKAAAAVTHDHIVTIHAVEESNGLPYLVMQYVAGQSLQERIDKDGPLELTDILRIGMQTASGLAAAHAHGIVHRDIKPANILLEEGVQRVKITDFGLARAMDDASLTQSGFVAGSPLYMAPEQARGEALDHRADLFSLGSVLYTMCTGRPPFRAANTLAVLRRVSEDRPRPIRETNPEVPDWLADIVAKLMAKDPAERFASAAEIEEVLGKHLAQLQHAAWVPPPRPPAPAGTNSDVAGLPTSLTICPSCGASLHVPERMVGSLVHCSECGKPFQVEEGSEVMQVARPARWPFGHWPDRRFAWWGRHLAGRCRGRWRLRGCLGIVAGCALLLFFFLFFVLVMSHTASKRPMTGSKRPMTRAVYSPASTLVGKWQLVESIDQRMPQEHGGLEFTRSGTALLAWYTYEPDESSNLKTPPRITKRHKSTYKYVLIGKTLRFHKPGASGSEREVPDRPSLVPLLRNEPSREFEVEIDFIGQDEIIFINQHLTPSFDWLDGRAKRVKSFDALDGRAKRIK